MQELDTVSGKTIIVGVPSASGALGGHAPPARYNEYNIARAGKGWRVEMIGRAAASPGQVCECERRLLRER